MTMPILRIGAVLPALLALVALVYWPGLHGGFLFDDMPNIVDNTTVHIGHLSIAAIKDVVTSGSTVVLGRPLSMLTFSLNHVVAGLDPFVFKVVNLVIHLINGVLVFLLARVVVRMVMPAASALLPLWVMTIWLLHPINIAPVLYIVQRMTSLSALFTLAGLLIYLQIRLSPPTSLLRKTIGWLMVGGFWGLGLLAKETAVLAPLFALLCELFLLRRNAMRGSTKSILGVSIAFTVVVVAVFMYLGVGILTAESFRYRDFSMSERVMTETRVLWKYVGMILLPAPTTFGLFHDDIAISRGWLSPWTTLTAALAWSAVLYLLLRYGRRMPLVGLGVAWFMAGHLLESTVLPLELVHEHRNYLPSFGLILAVGEVGRRLGAAYLTRMRLLMFTLALLPVAVVTFATGLRSYAYGDNLRLMRIEAANHPDSPRSHYEAGRALMQAGSGVLGMLPEARREVLAHFRRAAELDRDAKQPLLASIMFTCMYGGPGVQTWAAELRTRWQSRHFAIADRSAVMDMATHGIAGRLCLDGKAVRAQFEALLANPRLNAYDRATAMALLGNVVQSMSNETKLARSYYDQALKLQPLAGIRLRYAQLLFEQHDYMGARRMLSQIRDSDLNEDWQPGVVRELRAGLAVADPAHQR